MFKIDLKNWPNFLEMMNSYLNPWNTNPEAWENYDYNDGVFVFEGSREGLKDILVPVLRKAYSLITQEQLSRNPEVCSRNALNVTKGEIEDLALFLETVEG